MAASTHLLPIPEDTKNGIVTAIDLALKDLNALPFIRRVEQRQWDKMRDHDRVKLPRKQTEKEFSSFRYPYHGEAS